MQDYFVRRLRKRLLWRALSVCVIAVLAALSVASPVRAATFGETSIGNFNGNGFSADVKRCTTFSLNETGTLTSLKVYTGGTPGFTGSQAIRGVVYSMAGATPLNLKATTAAITVTQGQAMAWQTLSISPGVQLDPGTYCLGVHSGTTEGVADFRYSEDQAKCTPPTSCPPKTWFKSTDTYSDGASNPFGTPSDTQYIHLSIYAEYMPAKTCTKYAATSGSNSNSGSATAPYATVTKLLSVLSSGQTGCLIPTGTFAEKVTINNGVSLKTDPRYSNRATIRGRIEVPESANNVWVDNIILNVRNGDLGGTEIGLQVIGDSFKLTNSELFGDGSTASGSCIILGANGYGYAYSPAIERNRIHNCGGYEIAHDHGIYASLVRGGTIRDNYFYDTAFGWDIHLYPDADNMTISNNTLDGSRGGIIFAGDGALSSDGNTLTNNISSNPTVRYAVEHYWGGTVGSGNTVVGTCVYSPVGNTFYTPISGYTASGSITGDPLYVNRAAKDLRLTAASPCAGKGVRPN